MKSCHPFLPHSLTKITQLLGCICLMTGMVVGATATLLVSTAPPASASVGPPANAPWSYYAVDASTSTAYNLGCNQGNSDAKSGLDSSTILDFFGQVSDGSGTDEDFGESFISNANIESMAENFALGYYACTGNDTTTVDEIGIGTNNDGQDNGTSGGQTWAAVVTAVVNWVQTNDIGQVLIVGANDIEVWSDPSVAADPAGTEDWVKGFGSTDLYYDFGSANGCPETTHDNGRCEGAWYQHDYWYVSYGATPALAVPEVCADSNAEQWGEISAYGSQYENDGIVFTSPFTEYLRDLSCFTAAQSWDALETYTGQSQGFAYNMQIAAGYV